MHQLIGQVENGPQKVRERLVRAVPTPIAELRFPRRLGEKCLEELDDVDAPAFRAFPLPFLVLLEGEDFLEPVVAFPAFVRIGGHGTSSFSGGTDRIGSSSWYKDYK